MLRDKLQKQHRRNRSQLHFTKTQSSKQTAKAQESKEGTRHPKAKVRKNRGDADLVHRLVAKSVKKVPHKQVIIEDIEGDPILQESEEEFFHFGKKAFKTPATNIHLMEEIAEVPDTGNYSQRQTEDFPDDKQNRADNLNRQKGTQHQKLRISLDQITKGKKKDDSSQRAIELSSKRSKSSRENNCSLSTIDLRARKPKAKSKAKAAKKGLTAEVDKQIKLIWDCISDIWIQNRITQKNYHQSSERIDALLRKSEFYERELLQLKTALKERRKPDNHCFK